MKVCRICETTKQVSDFHLQRSARTIDGKYYDARYRSECKQCRKRGGAAHSRAADSLMRLYNLTRPPIGTPCDNCGKKDQKLVFDHDHHTDKFRGWLCYQCNTAIGNLGDDTTSVCDGLSYLIGNDEEECRRIVNRLMANCRKKQFG